MFVVVFLKSRFLYLRMFIVRKSCLVVFLNEKKIRSCLHFSYIFRTFNQASKCIYVRAFSKEYMVSSGDNLFIFFNHFILNYSKSYKFMCLNYKLCFPMDHCVFPILVRYQISITVNFCIFVDCFFVYLIIVVIM